MSTLDITTYALVNVGYGAYTFLVLFCTHPRVSPLCAHTHRCHIFCSQLHPSCVSLVQMDVTLSEATTEEPKEETTAPDKEAPRAGATSMEVDPPADPVLVTAVPLVEPHLPDVSALVSSRGVLLREVQALIAASFNIVNVNGITEEGLRLAFAALHALTHYFRDASLSLE